MKKDLLIGAFLLLVLSFILSGVKIQSVEDYYQEHLEDVTKDSESVTLTIRCDTLLEHYNQLDEKLQQERYVPSDGVILETTQYVLRPNDSVFDILQRAVRNRKIQMEYQGADQNLYGSVYIKGINYLYEFSAGPLSGWIYKVNSTIPDYGSSRYQLKDGDQIEFHYTCDLGRDLGSNR